LGWPGCDEARTGQPWAAAGKQRAALGRDQRQDASTMTVGPGRQDAREEARSTAGSDVSGVADLYRQPNAGLTRAGLSRGQMEGEAYRPARRLRCDCDVFCDVSAMFSLTRPFRFLFPVARDRVTASGRYPLPGFSPDNACRRFSSPAAPAS
jgi:hypothetical protein